MLFSTFINKFHGEKFFFFEMLVVIYLVKIFTRFKRTTNGYMSFNRGFRLNLFVTYMNAIRVFKTCLIKFNLERCRAAVTTLLWLFIFRPRDIRFLNSSIYVNVCIVSKIWLLSVLSTAFPIPYSLTFYCSKLYCWKHRQSAN